MPLTDGRDTRKPGAFGIALVLEDVAPHAALHALHDDERLVALPRQRVNRQDVGVLE
jgi:hypothetical protein